MTYQMLVAEIHRKKTFLCVGLDTDIQKIPQHLLKEKDPVLSFNKAIIEATQDLCVAYKINTAFYEAQGRDGWESMAKTLEIIPKNIFTIADAKRGDIGNTVHQYAKAFFETLDFDAITVAPYMGFDSVSPFLEYKDKWVILLGLTSNASSQDFQFLKLDNQAFLFEKVLDTAKDWASQERLMFVVGATQAKFIEKIRQTIPEHFFLVPGVGSQGGSLESVAKYGLNKDFGLLINASRSIIYASPDRDFSEKAREAAKCLREDMKGYFA